METVNKKYPLFCCLFCVQGFFFPLVPTIISSFSSTLCSLYIGMCDEFILSNLSTKYTAK